MSRVAIAIGLVALGCGGLASPPGGPPATDAAAQLGLEAGEESFRVLLFSRTAGYRHDSIPTAIAAFMDLQLAGGYRAEVTEDPTKFTVENLGHFQVVVFLMTTGDVLDDTQQVAFEAWMNAGGGYLGIHSASDTEYDWPFYGQLVGAYFSRHPDIQQGTVHIEDTSHPAVASLPSPWSRRDEWYDFQTNPRPNVTVLATLDESSYVGGTMGADHPIVWAHENLAGGRALYTAMGHTEESYAEAPFRRHLAAALRWVAGR